MNLILHVLTCKMLSPQLNTMFPQELPILPQNPLSSLSFSYSLKANSSLVQCKCLKSSFIYLSTNLHNKVNKF